MNIENPEMNQLKLYWAPGACSFVAHSMLNLTGAPFDQQMVNLRKGEQHAPEYLALNPNAQVPLLTVANATGTEPLTQIVAIVQYLDALYPSAGILPQAAWPRAKALELLAWMNNTGHPTFTHVFMPQKFAASDAAVAEIRIHNAARFGVLLAELNTRAAKLNTDYMLGEQLSAVDAYALTLARWGTIAGHPPEANPELWRYLARVAAHPAIAQTMESERIQLDMSAYKVV